MRISRFPKWLVPLVAFLVVIAIFRNKPVSPPPPNTPAPVAPVQLTPTPLGAKEASTPIPGSNATIVEPTFTPPAQAVTNRQTPPPNTRLPAAAREPTAVATVSATPALSRAGTTYFVSKLGNNADGRNWATAWNELNRVNWNEVKPGDTIVLDGGQTQMTYTTTMTVQKSGTAAAPITIKLSDEAGRNGKAVIFGGRSTLLPWYGQPGYVYDPTARMVGIDLRGAAWIVVDGSKWSGIDLHGFDDSAIWLSALSGNDTVRYVEIYDNGTVKTDGGLSHAERPGVALAGSNVTFERVIIHDDGEDSFQSGGGLANFTLRDSWLYQNRHNPSGEIWNFKQHPDGIQIYAGGEINGIRVEGCVIGPGFMQGVLLGQSRFGNPPKYATVDNVTIKNSLFYGNGNANILSQSPPTTMTGWRIENVTSDRPDGEQWHNVGFTQPNGGSGGISIINSIFTGGSYMTVPSGGEYVGNVYWHAKPNPAAVGTDADPEYADPKAYGSVSLNANYTLKTDSPFAEKGSPLHSAAQLVGDAPLRASASLLPSSTTP